MQASTSITFTPVQPHPSVLEPWKIVVGILLFAALIYFAVWRSRRNSNKSGSLNLGGK